MMSANITAASTPWRRTGCSVTSAQSSGVCATSQNECRSRSARYSGQRPPRLPHEPDGRALDRLAARRADEEWLHDDVRLALRVERTAWHSLRRRLPAPAPEAGALARSGRASRTPGSVAWRDGVHLSYHWLDSRDNPIVWDGVRTPPPQLAPGERATVELAVRAPIPPGPYRLALDARRRAPRVVLGARQRDAARSTSWSASRTGEPSATLPPWVEATPAWDGAHARRARRGLRGRRRLDRLGRRPAVAGARAHSSRTRRAPAASPAFGAPLLCPSVLAGVSSSSRSATSPACPRSRRRATSRGSTTAGRCSELDRDPVVDRPEHERGERERDAAATTR